MSNFGNDDGPKPNGQPNPQASLNGFRLDSTQSSWLMDRLSALSEEDMLAMQAAQDQLGAQGGDVRAQDPDGVNIPGAVKDMPVGAMQNETPHGHGQGAGYLADTVKTSGFESSGHDGAAHPPSMRPPSQQQYPSDDPKAADGTGGYQMSSEDNEGYNPGAEDSSSTLLKEKISQLEKQISDMSRLSEQKTEGEGQSYRDELVYRGAQLGQLKDQQQLEEQQETEAETNYYRGSELHDENQEPAYQAGEDEYVDTSQEQMSQEQAGEADYEYAREYLEPQAALDGQEQAPAAPAAPVQYAGEPVVDQGRHDGRQAQGFAPVTGGAPEWQQQAQQRSAQEYAYAQQDAMGRGVQHGHQQQVAYGQQQDQYFADGGHDLPALPQFLSSEQPQNMMRPKIATVLGSLVAVAIMGGVAYSYLGEGVSDIVKSDFGGFSAKQPAKLSDVKTAVLPDVKTEALSDFKTDGSELESKQEAVDHAALVVAPLAVPAPGVASVDVNDFAVSKLVGMAGDDVPLNVTVPRGDFPAAFVVVRNLPEWAHLNKGRLVSGAWILGISDLDGLKVAVPDDQPGEFKFIMEFVHSADLGPVSRTVNAAITPVVLKTPLVAPQEDPQIVSIEPDKNPEMIKPPVETGRSGHLIIDEALEERWLERGTRLLRAGDLSAARLAFSHLAEQGSGRGALAMAMTFDPNQPSSRVVVGIVPDVNRARFWYNRAVTLGNDAAREAIRLLDK